MEVKNIDLKKVFESGQTFRWSEISEGRYVIPYLEGACKIEQTSRYGAEIIEEYGKSQDWNHYFDLYRNYEKMDEELKQEYPIFADAVNFSKGIRILNQAHLETLITFIFSANNNIKRIMNSVNFLCTKYGEKIYDRGGREVHLFPSIEVLSRIDEEEYRSFGAGYRAPYLVDTIDYIYKNQSVFEEFVHLGDEDLLKALESLKGVGPKVARCIALFSYSRDAMFPIDTWIKKAIRSEFNMPDAKDGEISKKVEEYFKKYPGVIQQYIFYYYRFGVK